PPPPPRIAMCVNKTLLFLFLMLVFLGAAWAQSIYVDQNSTNDEQDGSELYPYHQVGDALNHAVDDDAVDTIIILPGTYSENLNIINFPRNLTFRSTFDPLLNNEEIISTTIIQGVEDAFDSVFYLSHCSGQINFWGLSIRNGKGHFVNYDDYPDNWTQGGGICSIGTDSLEQYVSIDWCNIYENYACWGGGIYGIYASFTISNTNIHNNALYFRHLELPPDTHGLGRYNGSKGGGIYLAGGWSTISQCKIYSNRSYLEESHELYNPLCYGNASALVWRNTCAANDIGIIMEDCEIYDNITSTLDEQMQVFDWPCRDIVQIQRGVHSVEPGTGNGYNHVEINQCTITENKIITEDPGPNDPSVNAAVGILRLFDENHILGTINNNIVYGNTAGSAYNQDVSLVHQLYGGFYDDQHTPMIFRPTRIPIKYCCVNDAHNAGLYLDEGGGSIDKEPLFVDADSRNFSLRWDADAISPCIDSGNPAILDLIDYTPSDIGAKPYLVAHDYEKYVMPSYAGRERIKWMCFPVLNEITNGSCMNENFFSPIVDISILDYVKYKPYLSVDVRSMVYDEDYLLQYGSEIVKSTQGYKVKLQDDCLAITNIHSPGFLIPPDTVVNLHRFEGDAGNPGYGANWVGYFVKESTHPLKALHSVLDHLSRIETAKWTMIKQADGSWINSSRFVLNYGDLVILHSDRNCSFVWETPNPVAPFTLASPTAFTFQEKSSYTPFYISLPDAKNGELPSEIGLYVNGVCKGAVVVEDHLLHICAYLDDGEVLTPDNSFLVFYDPAKSARSNKSIYRMNYKQLSPTKSPSTYYMVNITDPQNSLPVPATTKIHQNYPNPFNPDTTIRYELPEDGDVQISVYNLKGQLVKQLLNRRESIGTHSIIWDGRDSDGRTCSSGVYYYRINNNGTSITKKMLMLK
ncbi:MAG: T9SS type A sorting domain-containing protein, partial [Candidatus Cloacimonetes bacterium]|nr:T9SS type A sorting domain-containing protein [Candidatus Cloacimonadota bacterium]